MMYLKLVAGYWTLFVGDKALFSFSSLADAVIKVPEAEVIM